MKYYIIAGEQSGDLHGAGLMKALKIRDPEADFRFWGGDRMIAEGGEIVKHIRDISVMGFWEVFKNLVSLIRNLNLCKNDISGYRPDALILIDYPGFNMRIAEFAKRLDIKVFYYISPKVWAWNQSRVKKIKRYVDHMLTIFPFETEFYGRFGYKVDYVGNPLLDAIESRNCKGESFEEFISRNGLSGKPVIAILPGSRIQEVKYCLPVMVSAAKYYNNYQLVIAGTSSVDQKIYLRFGGDIPVLFDQTYAILQHTTAAMVVSGTATLEAALLKVPMVVCYRGSIISYQIARIFIRVRYISLVNLIMDNEVVKELIQDELNIDRLKSEMDRILSDEDARDTMLQNMSTLKKMLGEPGASGRAAGKILGYIN